MSDSPTPNEPRLSREEMLEAARALLSRGYQLTLLYATDPDGVCECRPRERCKSPGKHPRETKWTDRPIRSAEDLSARWAQVSGTPNIGVMPDDGLIVIDVDRKKGKPGAESLAALEEAHGPLGEPNQTTASGGWHFVFRVPPGTDPASLPNRSNVADGVDILRAGRQFVAAPSQIGARRYTGFLPPREELPVLPAAWVTYLQAQGGDSPSARVPTDPRVLEQRLESLKAPSLERVREVVACIPNVAETDRKQYLWMAHAIKGACGREGTGEGLDIFTGWAAEWLGPVDPIEDERVFVTIRWENMHTGWPDLLRLATRHGYDDTADRLAQLHTEFATSPLTNDSTGTARTNEARPPRKLYDILVQLHEHLKTIIDPLERDCVRDMRLARIGEVVHIPFRALQEHFAALSAPHRLVSVQIVRPGPALRDALSEAPPQALVPGYVYAESQHVMYGTPQSLKTFTTLDLGLHLASGLPWLGRIPVIQQGVVFFAGEAARSLRVRIAAWCAARGISVEEAATLPFALIDAVPTLGKGDDGLLNAISRVQEAAAPFGVPVGLVILDNMTRMAAASGISTTDTGEYGRILAGIDSLGRQTQAATLTIYHVPVSDKSQSRPAGTYQSTANPDVIMKAEREGSDLSTVIRVAPPYGKSRGSVPPPDRRLGFKVQDVRSWLTRSYGQAGLALPKTLGEVVGDEFTSVDPSSDGSNGTATIRPPEAAGREALEQQFTSLVVDGEVTGQTTSGGARQRDTNDDQELKRRVLEAIERQPGGSGNTLRAALRGTRQIDIDHAVLKLLDEGLATDDRSGGRGPHAFLLTAGGRALLRAARNQDAAEVAETAAALAGLDQRG